MSQQMRNGYGFDFPVPVGQSMLVSSITGTYTATIVAGPGNGTALATDSTGGGTYGPYSGGVVIRLQAGANSLIDYDIAVSPALTYAGPLNAGYNSSGDVASAVDGAGIGYSLNPMRPIDHVAHIGDSRENLGFIGTNGVFHFNTGDTVLANNGTAFGLTFFTGARITHYNYAVSGTTTAQGLAQLLQAIADGRRTFSWIDGINDTVTGDETLASYTAGVLAVRRVGGLVLLHTDMPNASATAGTLARMQIINEGLRALARAYPDNVILIDAKSAFSDPETTTGIAYSTASGRDLTYSTDDTHQNGAGGLILSYMQAVALRSRTVPYIDATYSGDTYNLYPNAGLSGVGGTKPVLGTGSLADSLTADREGIATNVTKFYKVWNPVTVLLAGDTPVLWNQYAVLGERRYTYVAISVGTGTRATITTLPSSTTLYAETQPDGTDGGSNVGTVFMTLPAEDMSQPNPLRNQPFYWQYVEAIDSSATANHPIRINPTSLITSGFSVGDKVQASCRIRFLECAWQAFELSIACKDAGAAKTQDSFGPYYAFTNSQRMFPNIEGLCLTDPNFQIPATTTNILPRLYVYSRGSSIPVRFMFSRPTLRNLSV